MAAKYRKKGVRLNLGQKIVLFFASGCGLGYLPKAPGTFGTLLGIPLALGISRLNWPMNLIAIIFVIVFSIWISDNAALIMGIEDPSLVVIDEVAGMLLTMTALTISRETILTGFILFRILDILKPFPIGWMDQKITGGIGIVADDLIAGIMANFILRIGLLLFGH